MWKLNTDYKHYTICWASRPISIIALLSIINYSIAAQNVWIAVWSCSKNTRTNIAIIRHTICRASWLVSIIADLIWIHDSISTCTIVSYPTIIGALLIDECVTCKLKLCKLTADDSPWFTTKLYVPVALIKKLNFFTVLSEASNAKKALEKILTPGPKM